MENFFNWFSQLQHTLAHRQSHPLPRCIPGPPASLSQASGEKKKEEEDDLEALFLQVLSCIRLSFYLFLFLYKQTVSKKKKNKEKRFKEKN